MINVTCLIGAVTTYCASDVGRGDGVSCIENKVKMRLCLRHADIWGTGDTA